MVAVTLREDGGREEVEFFGDEALLFGCRHVPAGDVRSALVVCPSIAADFGANYQREVRLGRRLAGAGVVVQRFHPRGTGQSDGEAVNLTLDTMIADAHRALDRVRSCFPGVPVAVLGSRFGALVAGAVAATVEAMPIALWEPVVDPQRFVREGMRARAVHQLKAGSAKESASDELARTGFIDLLGTPVGASLFATPRERDLPTVVGDAPRTALLLQLERREGLRGEYTEVVDRWTAHGWTVTTRLCPSDESWWFVHDRLAPVDDALDATTDWLLAQS